MSDMQKITQIEAELNPASRSGVESAQAVAAEQRAATSDSGVDLHQRKVIENQSMDQERALYNTNNALVRNCHFGGPVDGESALKESSNFEVVDSVFDMRYVLWHDRNFVLRNVTLNEPTRAPLWYDHHGLIEDSKLHSIKNIRECLDMTLRRCDIDSDEFGWKCSALILEDCKLNSVYGLLDSKNVTLRRVNSTGKYVLQYVENALIEDCTIDTKDCLWHARNVTIKNSTISSEYLAWYSDGSTQTWMLLSRATLSRSPIHALVPSVLTALARSSRAMR